MRENKSPANSFLELLSLDPCTPEDYADLRELHSSAIKSADWRFYSPAEIRAKLKRIGKPDYTYGLLDENVMLAKMNGLLVGSSSWRPSNEHPQTAVISQLYVHPLFLNGGVASTLIKVSEQAAYDSGFRWISAQADFNSRAFFSRLGYENKGFKDCHSGNQNQYPLQVMTRHISTQYSARAARQTPSGSAGVHVETASE